MFVIDVERPADAPAIECLLDRSFGADRYRKASYRFREGVAPVAGLCRVARADRRLVGTIRFWPVGLAGTRALLLGPLGVEPGLRGLGIGRTLVAAGLALVGEEVPSPPVLLVGDPAYYAALGFVPAAPKVVMPGEDPGRLLAHAPLAAVPSGMLVPWSAADRRLGAALA